MTNKLRAAWFLRCLRYSRIFDILLFFAGFFYFKFEFCTETKSFRFYIDITVFTFFLYSNTSATKRRFNAKLNRFKLNAINFIKGRDIDGLRRGLSYAQIYLYLCFKRRLVSYFLSLEFLAMILNVVA
ncbi:hypothetical protein AL542_15770 [Grimontia hollisae]|nr:hypothetical protein AL542_15770 [Grimontia hollisae]